MPPSTKPTPAGHGGQAAGHLGGGVGEQHGPPRDGQSEKTEGPDEHEHVHRPVGHAETEHGAPPGTVIRKPITRRRWCARRSEEAPTRPSRISSNHRVTAGRWCTAATSPPPRPAGPPHRPRSPRGHQPGHGRPDQKQQQDRHGGGEASGQHRPQGQGHGDGPTPVLPHQPSAGRRRAPGDQVGQSRGRHGQRHHGPPGQTWAPPARNRQRWTCA